MKLRVLGAYKTDHFPLGGNICEEILLLENGRAVYLNPGELDEIFLSLADAKNHAVGKAEFSDGLTAAWSEGYEIKFTHILKLVYDRDDKRIAATLVTDDDDSEFVRSYAFADSDELARLIGTGEVVTYNGRWDGESSTALCPEYEGRACTTGGREEWYGVSL